MSGQLRSTRRLAQNPVKQAAVSRHDRPDPKHVQAIRKSRLIGREYRLAQIGFQLFQMIDGTKPGAGYEHGLGAICINLKTAAIGYFGRA